MKAIFSKDESPNLIQSSWSLKALFSFEQFPGKIFLTPYPMVLGNSFIGGLQWYQCSQIMKSIYHHRTQSENAKGIHILEFHHP